METSSPAKDEKLNHVITVDKKLLRRKSKRMKNPNGMISLFEDKPASMLLPLSVFEITINPRPSKRAINIRENVYRQTILLPRRLT
jgi:hypothetical protein